MKSIIEKVKVFLFHRSYPVDALPTESLDNNSFHSLDDFAQV